MSPPPLRRQPRGPGRRRGPLLGPQGPGPGTWASAGPVRRSTRQWLPLWVRVAGRPAGAPAHACGSSLRRSHEPRPSLPGAGGQRQAPLPNARAPAGLRPAAARAGAGSSHPRADRLPLPGWALARAPTHRREARPAAVVEAVITDRLPPLQAPGRAVGSPTWSAAARQPARLVPDAGVAVSGRGRRLSPREIAAEEA
jgi:hypothetical protein